MLNANKTITVVNICYDADADADVYLCRPLSGCSWYARDKVAVDSSGLHHARVFSIRIPEACAAGFPYYTPQQYKELSMQEKAAGWTLSPGSKILNRFAESISEAEFSALSEEDFCTVLEAHDNRGRPIPHWYVGGA